MSLPDPNYFRLRERAYALAAELADYLGSLDGEGGAMARELEPSIRVSESASSGSTYVELAGGTAVSARISDHGAVAGAHDFHNDATAAAMVALWLEREREL